MQMFFKISFKNPNVLNLLIYYYFFLARLDQCEIQLDSTMFLLENYLQYSKIDSQLS